MSVFGILCNKARLCLESTLTYTNVAVSLVKNYKVFEYFKIPKFSLVKSVKYDFQKYFKLKFFIFYLPLIMTP